MSGGDPLEQAVLSALNRADDDEREPCRTPDLSDHTADSDVSDPSGSDIDDDNAGLPPQLAQQQQVAPPGYRPGAQTGPKGVLADYRNFKRQEWAEKQGRNRRLMQRIKDRSMSLQLPHRDADAAAEEDGDDQDDEREALARYREHRTQQLMDSRHRQQINSHRPKFGSLRSVNSSTFLHEIDDESPLVPVIVHLWEVENMLCHVLDRCFKSLAVRYGHAKFVAIRSREAIPDFDPIALPTVLVYRAGELVANLVRFTDELMEPRDDQVRAPRTGGMVTCSTFSCQAVEHALIRHGGLSDADLCDMTLPTEYISPSLRFSAGQQEDSDED